LDFSFQFQVYDEESETGTGSEKLEIAARRRRIFGQGNQKKL